MSLQFTPHFFPYTGSTNDDLKELALKNAPEGTVIRAETQSMGRGRRARVWVSPPGNLYMSLLVRPKVALECVPELSFLSALSVAHALYTLGLPPETIRLKWPNDILAQAKKIGGILIESQNHDPHTTDWVVIGFGLNLTSHPRETTYPATDIFTTYKRKMAPEHVMEAILDAFRPIYDEWIQKGFKAIREEWCAHAYGIGEEIEITQDTIVEKGIFLGIDDQGGLKIKLDDTYIKTLRSGDVFFKSLDYSTP